MNKRYCTYIPPVNSDKPDIPFKGHDYSSYFTPGKPIEILFKARMNYSKKIAYLVKKHSKTDPVFAHAQVMDKTTILENYTENDFIQYHAARHHFLWLDEEEVNLSLSNSNSKHVLEKLEDE